MTDSDKPKTPRTILTIECSHAGAEKLRAAMESGELSKALGYQVLSMTPWSPKPDVVVSTMPDED